MPRGVPKKGRAATKRRTKTSRARKKAPIRGATKGRRKTRAPRRAAAAG